MTLLLSESNDISTSKVCDWMNYYNSEYILLTELDLITDVSIIIIDQNIKLEIEVNNATRYNLNDISSFWYRRGDFNLVRNNFENNSLDFYSTTDRDLIKSFIYNFLKNECYSIGNIDNETRVSRIDQAYQAIKVGFSVPKSLITSSKNKLLAFHESENSYVTKNIRYTLAAEIEGKNVNLGYTQKLNETVLETLPERFLPSLVQEKIAPAYEVRVFVWEEKLFAAAIFNFNHFNDKYIFDTRRSLLENSNNSFIEPIVLPDEIQQRVFKLFQKLEFKTGSIDFIVDKLNQYYFLEINHVGQFDWISSSCNYSIEQFIAKRLINSANEN